MHRPCRVIGFITDFGTLDPYVAAMKGVALDICPDIRLVDITHDVPSFDIERAAFILLTAYRYFPRGTVFVVVVDPGVGGQRRAIAIATKNYYFIGPDNGVLVPAAEDDGVERVVVLDNDLYFRKPVSASFHGRDIFTPVAAWLACGTPLELLGTRVDVETLVRPRLRVWHRLSNGCVELEVLHIDKFGNVILSQRFSEVVKELKASLRSSIMVRCKGGVYTARIERVFSVVPPGTLVLYEDSFGFAELAVNQGSAKELLKVSKGDRVALCIG